MINDPTGERHNGMPTFAWGTVDRKKYATRRQLAAMGLRIGGQDVAAEMHGWCKGHRQIAYLYLIALAKPQFTKTPAKQAAVWTAARSRYKCDGPCNRRWPNMQVIPRGGLCDQCRAGNYGPLTNDADYHETERAA